MWVHLFRIVLQSDSVQSKLSDLVPPRREQHTRGTHRQIFHHNVSLTSSSSSSSPSDDDDDDDDDDDTWAMSPQGFSLFLSLFFGFRSVVLFCFFFKYFLRDFILHYWQFRTRDWLTFSSLHQFWHQSCAPVRAPLPFLPAFENQPEEKKKKREGERGGETRGGGKSRVLPRK